MSRYPSGQPVTIPVTVQQRNTDGTYSLVDAGTLTIVVKLTQADGTSTTTGTYSSPTHDSTGHYHQDVPATDLTGLGHYQWTVTSTGTGAGVTFGDFDVFDPFEPALLPLADAKDMLNIPQATTTYDAEIQGWIASIESSLERFTGGPVTNRQVTERAEAVDGMRKILLRARPLVSVVSITAESSGTAVSTTDVKTDANAGIIQRATGWPFLGPFFYAEPWFTVVFVAGWGTQVPAAFSNFARIVVDHMWETQRMPVSLPMSGEEAVTVPGFSYLIPRRAAELLDGSVNGMPLRTEAYV